MPVEETPRVVKARDSQGLPPGAEVSGLRPSEIFGKLETSPAGLDAEEVRQRLARHGRNVLPPAPRKPLVARFLANFTHLMAILLWAGGIVGFAAAMPQLGMAIWSVNLINGCFSFWQEYKAERAVEALRRLLPVHARVRRSGTEMRVSADELVPGDVLLLEQGDRVPADAQLIYANELQVDQSTLTGESQPIAKHQEAVVHKGLARTEIPNLIFAGTTVVAGSAGAVVIATGANTEFGKIAHLTGQLTERRSPLENEMQRVTRLVTLLATAVGLVFFAMAVSLAHVSLEQGFIFAMGMIVAFVPEGMLPTITLSLALGVQRMARRKALVKRLSAVETLGCTSVILTDKTGTLTKNELTVREVWAGGKRFAVSGSGYDPVGSIATGSGAGERVVASSDSDLGDLLQSCALCNNARLLAPDADYSTWRVLGDPTEGALLVLCAKGGIDPDAARASMPRLRELPFDSRRKRMATIHRSGGRRIACVKGAPRELLELCQAIRLEGKEHKLTEELRKEIMATNDALSREGLRVLAVARRDLGNALQSLTPTAVETDLTFLGLLAMIDPPHPEVADAVARCHDAGVRVVMITGDYGLTAESIARRTGILRVARARIITGAELDTMDDAALGALLGEEVIFARAAPEHKLRVVDAFQRAGHVVAVTGDGVNDAPALKLANIGVAMGVAGTDVARESADMILLDDNFASIVNAVEEGRTVYTNIRRFATYIFTSNMAEAVPFVVMLFSRGAVPLPLTVMQVLSVDLGTDMVPALALGAEPPEEGVMRRPPRSLREPLLNAQLLTRALLWYGVLEAAAALSAYFFFNWQLGWPAVPLAGEGTSAYRAATTMTLAGIVAGQVGTVLCCRSDRTSLIKLGLLSNRLVLWGIGAELILLAGLMYIPSLQPLFNTAPLDLAALAFAFAWAPVIVACDEVRKAWMRRSKQV